MSKTGKLMSSFCYADEKPVLLKKYDPKTAEKKCQDLCPEYYKEPGEVVIEQIFGSVKRKRVSDGGSKKRRQDSTSKTIENDPSNNSSLLVDSALGESAHDDEIDWSDCDMEISKNISLVDNSLVIDGSTSPEKDSPIRSNLESTAIPTDKNCQDLGPEYHKDSGEEVLKQINGSVKRKQASDTSSKKRRHDSTSKTIEDKSANNSSLLVDSALGESAHDDEIDWSDCDMEISRNISLVDNSLAIDDSASPKKDQIQNLHLIRTG